MEAALSTSTICPSWILEIPSIASNHSYRLSVVIYLGTFHFTCQLILKNWSVWKYDGQINNGVPTFDFIANKSNADLLQLLTLDSRKAHILIYSLTPDS